MREDETKRLSGRASLSFDASQFVGYTSRCQRFEGPNAQFILDRSHPSSIKATLFLLDRRNDTSIAVAREARGWLALCYHRMAVSFWNAEGKSHKATKASLQKTGLAVLSLTDWTADARTASAHRPAERSPTE